MTLYILDTDHLSLYGRNHSMVVARLRETQGQLATTAINVEEQLRGRLAQIAEADNDAKQSMGYQRLVETVMLLSEFQILPYDQQAQVIYRALKAQRLRVGTQDLRIASITLAHNGILLTRNLRDFEKVPGLAIQDWSI